MDQTGQTPSNDESLASRVSLFVAALLLNSIIYQFAMYATFFEGMKGLGFGLIAMYLVFICFAMYRRRLSAMCILTQIVLSAAFFSLGNEFVLTAKVPVGVGYIKKYVSILLFVTQLLVPLRFFSRRGFLIMLWIIVGMFCMYGLVALYAGIAEQEAAIRAGGYAALGERGLGKEQWLGILRQSCVTAGLLAGMVALSLSRRGDWPADRKRIAKTPAPRRA